MSKITTNQFQKGMFIEFKSEPNQIIEFQHVNPGKGSAFVRTKLKSVKTGKVQEFTFKSGESAEEVPVNVREMQYLYKTDNVYNFMDKESYEQYPMNKEMLGNFSQFIKEGNIYQLLIHENLAIGMRFPKKVRLIVTEADEGAKGNTVSGAKKTVIVETGAEIVVPLFIRKGDVIGVDAETGEYLDRLNQK